MQLNKEIKSLLRKAPKAPMPENIEPMLATLVDEPVTEQGWLYEMKWDGYRAVAYLGNKTELRSRNNKSFNEKYYPLYESLQKWGIKAVLDGELVVVNEQGLPDFAGLQQWRSEADGELLYYIFDILWLDGHLLTDLPLEARKQILKALVPTNHPHFRLSETLTDNGAAAFEHAKSLHLEGVMAKQTGSPYVIGSALNNLLVPSLMV